MKMMINTRRYYWIALLLIVLFSCKSNYNDLDSKARLVLKEEFCFYFNQSLLKECIPFLIEETGVTIELSPEVKIIDDLTVDLDCGNAKYPLSEILDRILLHIKNTHNIDLKMVIINGCIVIYRRDICSEPMIPNNTDTDPKRK